jgi:hypothetical protein
MNQPLSHDSFSDRVASLARISRKPKTGFLMDHVLVTRIVIVAAFIAALFLADGMSRDYASVTFHLGKESRAFQGEIVTGMTVLDALNAATLAGKITLQFSLDEHGTVHILDLGGAHPAEDQIRIMVNGERIPTAKIGSTTLRAHDRVEVTTP